MEFGISFAPFTSLLLLPLTNSRKRAQPQHSRKASVFSQTQPHLQLFLHCRRFGLQKSIQTWPIHQSHRLCTMWILTQGRQNIPRDMLWANSCICHRAAMLQSQPPDTMMVIFTKTTDPDSSSVSHEDMLDKSDPHGCCNPAVKAMLGTPNRSEPCSCYGMNAESFSIRD